MKFKDSVFESRYNELWNTQVVAADNEIKEHLIGYFSLVAKQDLTSAINKYCQNVLNILNNISRQLTNSMFEDPEEVEAYIEQTKEAALDDLATYRSKVVTRYGADSSYVELIDDFTGKIETAYTTVLSL